MADKECPNCGSFPMGEGCYHICYNSVAFYSPEQERADEAHYGDDDHRERYAATAEPSQYWTDDPRMYDVTTNWPLPDPTPINDEDIPF